MASRDEVLSHLDDFSEEALLDERAFNTFQTSYRKVESFLTKSLMILTAQVALEMDEREYPISIEQYDINEYGPAKDVSYVEIQETCLNLQSAFCGFNFGYYYYNSPLIRGKKRITLNGVILKHLGGDPYGNVVAPFTWECVKSNQRVSQIADMWENLIEICSQASRDETKREELKYRKWREKNPAPEPVVNHEVNRPYINRSELEVAQWVNGLDPDDDLTQGVNFDDDLKNSHTGEGDDK